MPGLPPTLRQAQRRQGKLSLRTSKALRFLGCAAGEGFLGFGIEQRGALLASAGNDKHSARRGGTFCKRLKMPQGLKNWATPFRVRSKTAEGSLDSRCAWRRIASLGMTKKWEAALKCRGSSDPSTSSRRHRGGIPRLALRLAAHCFARDDKKMGSGTEMSTSPDPSTSSAQAPRRDPST